MGWLAAQGAIMAIGLFIGLVCSVIGLFFGHIILFDSIALGIAAGVCCNQFTAIHPALCLVIGVATFLLLLWLQNTSIGFWLVGGLLTLIYAAVFGLLAYFISEHDPIWGWVIFALVMSQNDKIQLFEDKRIRTAWDEEKEEWYFSIVDVVAVLTDSPNPQTYWRVLKKRLKDEGNETVTSCNALKMTAADGKRRLTYVADTEQFLRIVQSIPSPKAEPFRAWLAQVGRERIEETIDPELTIEKALETYLKKGYTREWINQRMQAIQVRKELTDERDARGVQKGVEYAILTDEISRAWSGMSTRQYKNLKGLKKKNHRDNMTTLELVLNMLAEATTTEIPNQKAPSTFSENIAVAREGGEAAGIARKAVEERTGVPVITSKNAAQLNQVVTDLLEGAAADMSEMPEKK